VLRDDAAEPSTAAVYDDILRELNRVNGILQRLLESGRQAPLRLARTDLGRLLEGVAELMQPALRRRRVELKIEAARDLPQTEIDAARIRQVLLNLVQNAGDALEQNGGRVTIRANFLPGNAGIVIAVEDDGPGIPREDLARLFEPFFTTKFTGTGLGLTISKGWSSSTAAGSRSTRSRGAAPRSSSFSPRAAPPPRDTRAGRCPRSPSE